MYLEKLRNVWTYIIQFLLNACLQQWVYIYICIYLNTVYIMYTYIYYVAR